MASDNASRALLALGQGLGNLASMSWQREQAAADAERQENLERLRQGHDVRMAERREAHDRTMEQQRVDSNVRLAEVERGHRRSEADTAFARQKELLGREEGLQRERWGREDRMQVERMAQSQMEEIDGRILDIRDAIDKGEYTDPVKAEQEIGRLRDQRARVRQDLIIRLADMGDPRYPAQPAPRGRGSAAKNDAGAPAPAARAAQSPAAKGLAPVPEPPPGMKEREPKKRSVLEEPITRSPGGGRPKAGEGARQAGELLGRIADQVRGDFRHPDELKNAAQQVRAALREKKPIPAEAKALLRGVRERALLKAGLTADEIAALRR